MAYVPIIIAFGMMALAIPVPVCLLAGTIVYFQFINPSMPLTGVIQNLITQSMSTSMLAPPFYIAAACVMTYSGISERLLDMCDCLLGHKKGGLAYVNVLLSTLNGGMSGSANADAAMQCKMLVPEMEKKGYPKAFCCVVTAASSLITPIIPPGVPLILYAMMAGVSIGRMWVSGYIPGFMLCIAMMIVCYIYAHKYNWSSGRTERASGAEIARSIWRSSLAMIIPLFMIFGLRSGAFTATEGGTVLLMLAIVIGICYRKLHISHIVPIIKESFVTTATVMLIVVSACGFSMYQFCCISDFGSCACVYLRNVFGWHSNSDDSDTTAGSGGHRLRYRSDCVRFNRTGGHVYRLFDAAFRHTDVYDLQADQCFYSAVLPVFLGLYFGNAGCLRSYGILPRPRDLLA